VVRITDKFKGLDQERQNRILRAAFQEFGEHGYDKASTNRIVKEAGISKGMLFYYFNNKQELFQDLLEIGINYILDEYLSRIDEGPQDFFERYRQASILKLEALSKQPEMLQFFTCIYLKKVPDFLTPEIHARLTEMRTLLLTKLSANVDTSRFRKDIPQEKSIQLIGWCMDGYEKMLTAKMETVLNSELDLQSYFADYYEYLDLLRTVFYEN